MSERELVIVDKEREVVELLEGGYLWTVLSWRVDDYAPTLIEKFQSADWAIVCAEQRVAEGYHRVEAYHAIAFSFWTDAVEQERLYLMEEQRQEVSG
ncbi:hypothetical protein CcrJ4_gp447 [Caulobacter phage J4]|nr:hypothetical protein CcrJ4_gp447 [Caulobacter phage J4]